MPVGGLNAAQAKAMASAIDLLKTAGATVIDPVEIPSIVATDPSDNALLLGICYDLERGKSNDKNCSVILKYGMKRDFNKWLDSLGESAPVTSLTGLRNFNTAHQAAGAIRYGQAQLDISDEMDVEADAARFRADRDKDLRLARTEGLDVALRKHELAAFLMPSWFGEELLTRRAIRQSSCLIRPYPMTFRRNHRQTSTPCPPASVLHFMVRLAARVALSNWLTPLSSLVTGA
jgi:amidase